MTAKYEVVDRLRYDGEDFGPGDEVYLEEVHAEPLLREAVVKPIDSPAKSAEGAPGLFEGVEDDAYPPEALADVIAKGIEADKLEMTKSGAPEVGSVADFLKELAGDDENVKTNISADERNAAWEVYQARGG